MQEPEQAWSSYRAVAGWPILVAFLRLGGLGGATADVKWDRARPANEKAPLGRDCHGGHRRSAAEGFAGGLRANLGESGDSFDNNPCAFLNKKRKPVRPRPQLLPAAPSSSTTCVSIHFCHDDMFPVEHIHSAA